MAPAGSMLKEVADAFDHAGVDLAALGLAWARVSPTVALVPAFGLRALPAPARAIVALAIAGSIFPALAPEVLSTRSIPWALVALGEVVRGLPIAIAAAVPLWAATMAGGLADTMRGAQDAAQLPTVEGRATPLGVLLSLFASAVFLSTGGPARVAAALATKPMELHPIVAVARDLVDGIVIAVSIGGPLLAASMVLEIAGALVARAASPTQMHATLAPLRAIGILAIFGVVLERIATLLGSIVASTPG